MTAIPTITDTILQFPFLLTVVGISTSPIGASGVTSAGADSDIGSASGVSDAALAAADSIVPVLAALSVAAMTALLAIVIVYGLLSILNGPATSTVAVSIPVTFLGSRHESEQVPPHPYSKLKLRSYEPSLFLIRSFGARG